MLFPFLVLSSGRLQATNYISYLLPLIIFLLLASSLSGYLSPAFAEENENTHPAEDHPLIGHIIVKNDAADIELPIGGLTYTLKSKQGIKSDTRKTPTNGTFEYHQGDEIRFKLGKQTIGPFTAQATLTHLDLIDALCQSKKRIADCKHHVRQNMLRTLASIDNDHDASNGYFVDRINAVRIKFLQPTERFEISLRKKLRKKGITLTTTFIPSLGINLEEPQPENDSVGGQPLAFVDLFRVARPFKEYSCPGIQYDKHGWPLSIPPACAYQKSHLKQSATTSMLRHVPAAAVPQGRYTVLYEGQGKIRYSGIAKLVKRGRQRDVISLAVKKRSDIEKAAGLRLQIIHTNPANPIRNIRVVMPGGICEDDIFTRITRSSHCKGSRYISFVEQLAKDRNNIVFNPDFLRELRNFKVFRTMNFMKASPRAACRGLVGEKYQQCLLQPFTWERRPKLDDAVWGGSAKTPLEERYGKGVPLEVIVQLANLTQSDPWFNIVHSADNDYIKRFARYVEKNLDENLKTYIEYSNETWNGSFWASHYVRQMGKNKGYHRNPQKSGNLYYAKRASDIFKVWAKTFHYDKERYVRVLGGHQTNPIMSAEMLSFRLPNGKRVKRYVDALAIGTYFHGCWNRRVKRCQDKQKVPKTLSEAHTLNDVFSIITNPNDPYSLPSLNHQIKKQMRIAKKNRVDLISYEGGQHVVVNWNDHRLFRNRKEQLTRLFASANRDRRMGELYTQLFKSWKQSGGTLMTLYTLPQSYHRWGNWGLKEHLNKPRSQSPKYDAAMRFMEEQDSCWWKRCL